MIVVVLLMVSYDRMCIVNVRLVFDFGVSMLVGVKCGLLIRSGLVLFFQLME